MDGHAVTTLATKILKSQIITLHHRARSQQSRLLTVLINKPLGYVSGLPEKGYQSAVMLINKENRHNTDHATPQRHGLAPAGRLDIDSTGLMVFTQDGRIAKTLIGANSAIEKGAIKKEYRVRISGDITASKIKQLRHGLLLDGKALKPAKAEKIKAEKIKDWHLIFTLIEGRKRQILRMCELVGLKVTGLTRVRIGKIKLGKLGIGKWRLLRPDERF